MMLVKPEPGGEAVLFQTCFVQHNEPEVGKDALFVLRQNGVDEPYDGYLEAGALSDPISLGGGDRLSPAQAFLAYIPIGFDHIVPKGLDHILFVLGLFFLSTRLRPLLWQVSAFTVAHTVTLGLGALGYVTLPPAIVEPVIAASIVFVAIENILTSGLSRWRPSSSSRSACCTASASHRSCRKSACPRAASSPP